MKYFIGKKIKELREKRGLSQRELADLSGHPVTHSVLSNVENEKWGEKIANPSFAWFEAICKGLGITYDEFLFELITDSFEVLEVQTVKKWIKDNLNNFYKLEITITKISQESKKILP